MNVFARFMARIRSTFAGRASVGGPSDVSPVERDAANDRANVTANANANGGTDEDAIVVDADGRRGSPSTVDPRLERLVGLMDRGAADGTPAETEAVALLRELRMTHLEPLALAALGSATATCALGEALVTSAAKACIDRGELDAARRFLRHTTGPDALLLAADLADEAGDAPAALALIERVLARAIDHPGARERHTRLALSLGRRAPPLADEGASRPADGGTVMSAHVDSPYVMRRELARGGAAAVYEAEDRELQRRVALKVYHDPENGRDQLLHEARVAIELAATGIIRVYDVDVRGGWLVLEYFEHGSLREWLRNRPDEITRWAWLPSLVQTLADLHGRGYAHLDVKPGNVLLRSASETILADFGTARRIGEPSPPGSLGYVSPERFAGAPASALDDVYGVGRIIEEVLAVTPSVGLDVVARMQLTRLSARLTGYAAERPDLRAVVGELNGSCLGGARA